MHLLPPASETFERLLAELLPEANRLQIGLSREGRPLHGVLLGTGPLCISMTAGAHSDEPAGPLAAIELIRYLTQTKEGSQILERTSWRICPLMNPDGSAINASWFREPLDLRLYMEKSFREQPGDDVEFNYPSSVFTRKPRTENEAVAQFLREGGPYHLHASLHGMGFATGAWWLIGQEWRERTESLRVELLKVFKAHKLGLHDMDRGGEKGFTRIAPGFATTPSATAMRAFFESQGDPEQAEAFLPSSMEFVQSLGADPLVMVSELPLFRIHRHRFTLAGEGSFFESFRPRMASARQALLRGEDGPLLQLVREHDIRPVPISTQVAALRDSLATSVRWVGSCLGIA